MKSVTLLGAITTLAVSSCATLNGDPCKDYVPFTATCNSPLEVGQNIELHASYLPSAQYHWTGPNGFTSAEQDPVLYFVNFGDSGSYKVTATANDCHNIPPAFTRVIMTYPEIPCSPDPVNQFIFSNGFNSVQYGTLFYSNTDGYNHFSAGNFNSDFSICLWGDSLPKYDNVYDIENSYCGDFIDGGHANINFTMFYYYYATSGNVYVKVFPDKVTMTFCDVSFGPFSASGTMVYYK